MSSPIKRQRKKLAYETCHHISTAMACVEETSRRPDLTSVQAKDLSRLYFDLREVREEFKAILKGEHWD